MTASPAMIRPSLPSLLWSLLWLLGGLCSVVIGQQEWYDDCNKEINPDFIDPWRDKPWGRPGEFDNSVVVQMKDNRFIRGFSIPYHIDDLNWNRCWQEVPPWFIYRINCFLGVPYAEPPLGRRRFQRAEPPSWAGTLEAKQFRPACPQDVAEIQQEIPSFTRANISEDCLYMNIYTPNITWHSKQTLYPVLVWIHSGNFSWGTAQLNPGHVVTTREVVVVTFNYRLGALGWLTTEDQYSSGNYGLFDQHRALEFIKEYIRDFRGDPNKITLAGEGAGATSVGMHLLSPWSRGKKFFHQTILMSGTDLSRRGFVSPYWRPRDYALELGRRVGCPEDDAYLMLECLRDSDKVTWQMIVDAQRFVQAKDGSLGIVWGPTQDGGWFNVATYKEVQPYLPQTPIDLRYTGDYDALPTIIGINTQDGAQIAMEAFGAQRLEAGLFRSDVKKYISSLLTDWNVDEYNRDRAVEAVEFQYTWWAEPGNRSAQTQEFFNLLTDLNYGVAMDEVLKLNARQQNTYMYQFNYRSWSDWRPKWMGVSHSAAVPYIFGFPFFNETILDHAKIIPRQHFDYEDRNMSDWMMMMWTNFVKFGEPTPNITYNITWEPFNFHNLSFLQIEDHSHIWFRYRQNKYGFWRDFFPTIAQKVPYFPTPTPEGYEYVIATGSLSALLIMLFCGLAMLTYVLWWHARQQRLRDEYRTADIPLSFMSREMKAAAAGAGGGASRGGGSEYAASRYGPGSDYGASRYGPGSSYGGGGGGGSVSYGAKPGTSGMSQSQSQHSLGSLHSGGRGAKPHDTSQSTQYTIASSGHSHHAQHSVC